MKTSVLFLLFIPFFAFAQVAEMTVEDLTRTSDAIVVGTCVEKESFWNEKGDKIFTRIRLKADQYLKGDMGEEAIITMPGGRVGDIIYEVSDIPLFNKGEEMVAFLWTHPKGITMVNGGLHGKKLIIRDKRTGKKMIRESFKSDTHEKPAEQKILLDDYLQHVRSYIRDTK